MGSYFFCIKRTIYSWLPDGFLFFCITRTTFVIKLGSCLVLNTPFVSFVKHALQKVGLTRLVCLFV